MNLLPTALIVEQLHMKALVAVLLRGIDIVSHTAGALLEIVRQHGIDIQAQFLLLLKVSFPKSVNFWKTMASKQG